MSVNKQLLLEVAEGTLKKKLSDIQLELDELDGALKNETKSSAGDKYETSREMIQQEREKLYELQANTKRMLDLLSMSKSIEATTVETGALVQTDKALLHISIPLGKIIGDEVTAFFISPSSPLAQSMLNKKVDAEVTFNGVTHKILSIS
jgi:transcription elongation GreA/GreB family factor